MKAPRATYNPFIVLSDVTISTLVVLACLLMLFSALVTTSARLQRSKEEQVRGIENRQNDLIKEAKTRWNPKMAVLYARGLQYYLCRFPDKRMFDSASPDRLSAYGQDCIREWAIRWGPQLVKLEGDKTGDLIEIQVQGHCSQKLSAFMDPQKLSINRAMQAAEIVRNTRNFPRDLLPLLSVSGYSWNRRAYKPTGGMVIDEKKLHPTQKNMNDAEVAKRMMKRGIKKTVWEDRIDLVLVFAGDQQDNNYVAAHGEDGRLFGPNNDVSVPDLKLNALTRQ